MKCEFCRRVRPRAEQCDADLRLRLVTGPRNELRDVKGVCWFCAVEMGFEPGARSMFAPEEKQYCESTFDSLECMLPRGHQSKHKNGSVSWDA